MKIAFVSELPGNGKIPRDHVNMRTEMAWMCALDADHFNISAPLGQPQGYDLVIVIMPKGLLFLNTVGSKMQDTENPTSGILASNIIDDLKKNNKKVAYMQEGPSWLFNDYNIQDQFNFYTQLHKTDMIFAHNESDVSFYRGLFPEKQIVVMRSLMLTDHVGDQKKQEDKTLIGGNFCRWYGGFQSYIVAQEFGNEIWTQSSHAKQENEEKVYGLNHLERLSWIEWVRALGNYRYAVHLMPTVAAGTFSLNCAYSGVPCIGNKLMDTQKLCFPELAVDVDDVYGARKLAKKLKSDERFYEAIVGESLFRYEEHYSEDAWKKRFYEQI